MLSSRLCVLFLFAAVFFVFSDQGQGDNNRNNNPPRLPAPMKTSKEYVKDTCKNETQKLRSKFCRKLTQWSESNRPKSVSKIDNKDLKQNPQNSNPESTEPFHEIKKKADEYIGTLEKASEQLSEFKSLAEKGSTALQKVAGAAGKAAALAGKISKVLGKLSTVLGALGKLTSLLGPIGSAVGAIFSIVSMFIPQEDETEKMQKFLLEQFAKVHERFDILEMKLDKLELTIEKTVVYAGYIENQDRIHKVMFAHRMMLERATNKTIQEFQETCRLENPLFALDWIYRHALVDEDAEFGPHLLPTVFKDVEYNRTRLLQFFSVVLSDMMTTAYLREACIGAVFGLTNETLEDELNANREKMSEMISAVSRKMKLYEDKLMSNPGPQLAKDLADLVNETDQWTDDNSKTAIGKMKERLKEKYYWLEWSIYMAKTVDGYKFEGDETRFAIVLGKPHPPNVHRFLFFWAEAEREKLSLLEKSVKLVDFGKYKNFVLLKLKQNVSLDDKAANVIEWYHDNELYVFSYYYSKTTPDTIGCINAIEDLNMMTRDEACPAEAFASRVSDLLTEATSSINRCDVAKNKLVAFDKSKMWLVNCAKNVDGLYSITGHNQAENSIPSSVKVDANKLFAMWSLKNDRLLEFQANLADETLESTVKEIATAHGMQTQDNVHVNVRTYTYVSLESILNNITQFIADPTLYCQDNKGTAWYPPTLCRNPQNYYENKAVLAILDREDRGYALLRSDVSANNYASCKINTNHKINDQPMYLHVYVHYFTPSGLKNTPHCLMSKEELGNFGIQNATEFQERRDC